MPPGEALTCAPAAAPHVGAAAAGRRHCALIALRCRLIVTTAGDYWPGLYSRTHVGATKRDYVAVMRGLRDGAFYVRLRGTDAHRSQPGCLGAAIDPEGPALDVVGNADPWIHLWFYTNPAWVVPTR